MTTSGTIETARTEYRVRYKREGHKVKLRRYVSRERAERFAALLLDPTIARPADNLEGEGFQYDRWIESMPPLEYVRIESRATGPWTDEEWR